MVLVGDEIGGCCFPCSEALLRIADGSLVLWSSMAGWGVVLVMLFSDGDMLFLGWTLSPSSSSRFSAVIFMTTLSNPSSSSVVVRLRLLPGIPHRESLSGSTTSNLLNS